ncbi:MAG: hypothetical protein ACRCZB_04980 [Bacteroidales bacterium]
MNRKDSEKMSSYDDSRLKTIVLKNTHVDNIDLTTIKKVLSIQTIENVSYDGLDTKLFYR